MSGSNSFLNTNALSKRAIPMFVNSNAMLGSMNRQYSDQFGKAGAMIGDTFRIRTPSDFTVASGPTLALQPIVQNSITLTVASQQQISIPITSAQLALNVEEFDELILMPAMNRMAGYVANDVMSLVNTIPNVTANIVSGAIASPTANTLARAKATLTNNSAPESDIMAVFSPDTMANAGTQLTGLFNPTGRISKIFDNGQVTGPALGISEYMADALVPQITTGGVGNLPTINGAGQTGNVLTVTPNSTNPASLDVGDIIVIENVFAVNRVAHTPRASLRTLVVTAPYAAGGTSLSVYPAITPLGSGGTDVAFATVTASPASGATISTVIPPGSTIAKGFAMHKNAFTLATVDLPDFNGHGVVEASAEVYSGVKMRCLKAYNPGTDQLYIRFDVLYGYAALRPEWATVIPDVVSTY